MLAKTENQMLCVVVSVNIKHVLLKDIKLKYISTTTTVKSLAAQKITGKMWTIQKTEHSFFYSVCIKCKVTIFRIIIK